MFGIITNKNRDYYKQFYKNLDMEINEPILMEDFEYIDEMIEKENMDD